MSKATINTGCCFGRMSGWSAGGVLAYEIAHQLLGEDETVELLGLIDSNVPSKESPRAMDELTDDQFIRCSLMKWLEDSNPDRPDISEAEFKSIFEHSSVENMINQCHMRGWIPVVFTSTRLYQCAKQDIAYIGLNLSLCFLTNFILYRQNL